MTAAARPAPAADERLHWAVLVVPALLALVLGILLGGGFIASDDLEYAQIARSLLPGSDYVPLFREPNHHDARLGLTYPLAAAFLVFGSSPLALSLLPLVGTVLTAALVAALGARFWGNRVGMTAGVLYASIPLVIGLSTVYVPEPIMTFELCAAVMLVLEATGRDDRRRGPLMYAAGLLIGMAYLTTEVGVLLLPAVVVYLAATRRLRRADLWIAAGGLTVLGVELAYHLAVHGAPLYRFTSTASYTADPMVQSANRQLAYRLFKAYPSMFVYPGLSFGLLGPLLILGGIYGLVKWREGLLLVLWAGAIVLFYNFMSASFTHYVALPVGARLMAPAMAPLAVLSAKLVVDVWDSVRRRAPTAVFGVARVVAVLAVAVVAGVSILSMYLNLHAGLTREVARNAAAATTFLQPYPSVTLITDQATARAVDFLRDPGSGDRYLEYDEADRLRVQGRGSDPARPTFVAINGAVVGEGEITGQNYGGGLSLPSADRAALSQIMSDGATEVFTAHEPHGRFLEASLEMDAVGRLMGEFSWRIARALAAEKPAIAEIRIFSFDWPPVDTKTEVGRQ